MIAIHGSTAFLLYNIITNSSGGTKGPWPPIIRDNTLFNEFSDIFGFDN